MFLLNARNYNIYFELVVITLWCDSILQSSFSLISFLFAEETTQIYFQRKAINPLQHYIQKKPHNVFSNPCRKNSNNFFISSNTVEVITETFMWYSG